MEFNYFSIISGVELILVWWVFIYFLGRYPFDKQIRLVSFAIFILSQYFLMVFILQNIPVIYPFYINLERCFTWTIMLSPLAWYFITYDLLSKELKERQKTIFVSFCLISILFIYLTTFTNLIFNYKDIDLSKASAITSSNPLIPIGPLFWLFFLIFLIMGYFIFYNLVKVYSEKTDLEEKKKFKYFLIGFSIVFFGGFFFSINWLNNNMSVIIATIGDVLVAVGSLVIAYAFIKTSKPAADSTISIFGRDFLLSSLFLLVVYIAFILGIIFSKVPYSLNLLILLTAVFLLIPIVFVTQDWMISYGRNIIYKRSFEFPKVKDEDINYVIRNFNKKENLEDSPLLGLKLVTKKIKEGKTPVDALCEFVDYSIESLSPKEIKRSKPNLKYQILKMIAFDNAEEGQILWDLGFGEYPLEIAEKLEGERPRFEINHPTDYQATSRNAFISLKKEAIHDLAWRISYLERHTK